MLLAFALVVLGLLLLGLWGLMVLGEEGRDRVRRWLQGLEEVRGFLLRPGLFYHPGHTWVMPDGTGRVRIGIDDFGRRLVSGIRQVELPPTGARLISGRVAVQLDCGKKSAKLVSPVDGIVEGVNEALKRDGSKLERDPYGKGWLFTARVADRKYARLATGPSAKEWLNRESDQLSFLLHAGLGITAADGGELIPKPPAALSAEQWEALTSTFFRTPEDEKRNT